MKNIHYGT